MLLYCYRYVIQYLEGLHIFIGVEIQTGDCIRTAAVEVRILYELSTPFLSHKCNRPVLFTSLNYSPRKPRASLGGYSSDACVSLMCVLANSPTLGHWKSRRFPQMLQCTLYLCTVPLNLNMGIFLILKSTLHNQPMTSQGMRSLLWLHGKLPIRSKSASQQNKTPARRSIT